MIWNDEAEAMKLKVDIPEGGSVRVDRLIAERVDGLSRRRAQELLASRKVRVNGRNLRKGDALPGGTTVCLDISEVSRSPEPDPSLSLRVLYEDPWMLAIDKPAGPPSHVLEPGETATVANFLARAYPETIAAGTDEREAGLCHRLDNDTSGVLLVARNRECWTQMRQEFRSRNVAKRYLALVRGVVMHGRAITFAIQDDPRHPAKVLVMPSSRGNGSARPAITRFRPICRGVDRTLVDVEIDTGVRHQIRAHLAALGHPVVGDALYGLGEEDGVGRQLLHAAEVRFVHPVTGEPVTVTSPLPEDFRAALQSAGIPYGV